MNAWIHFAGSVGLALFLLTIVGNLACKVVLDWSGLSQAMTLIEGDEAKPRANTPRVGRLIGHLERLLIASGLVFGAWEILVVVVALKTVARFKDLDEKLNAEYFLVGSLFSVAWAILVTQAWMVYDATFGLQILSRMAD
ncbi:MAG: hypothetical protein MH112_06415 [Phenylobacterium sp.]|jgi:hypothetical protein|uniref:hypothetical protein n=1 Tax=Phenylobacterium sp. TaxID=1871053 RepID=UPI0025D5BAD8|nr:hypothetical protein [Phenylobacterium sp.]MCG9915980.1 hypothetical protein [Phenylobacterium sp.]